MRVPAGAKSRAVTRPEWYVRSLVNRAPDVASRGAERRKRPKVEDADQVDALQLYRSNDARSVARTVGPVVQGGCVVDFAIKHYPRGTKMIRVAGVNIRLTPRQFFVKHYGDCSVRHVTAECPACRRQYRYLYRIAGGQPQCRRCLGLIYESQARSQSRRYRLRWDAAMRQRKWDGIREIPIRWAYRFGEVDKLVERYAEASESLRRYQDDKRRRAAEERTRKTREREARRIARAVWREYLGSLGTRRQKDEARALRRMLAYLQSDSDDEFRPLVAALARVLANCLPEFPLTAVGLERVAESTAGSVNLYQSGSCPRRHE